MTAIDLRCDRLVIKRNELQRRYTGQLLDFIVEVRLIIKTEIFSVMRGVLGGEEAPHNILESGNTAVKLR